MSFQPVVTLTAIPRDNSAFTITDATPTGGTTGWGCTPYAPQVPASITSLFAQWNGYGENAIWANGVTGAVTPGPMTFSAALLDGVNTYTIYYGMEITLTQFVVSADGLSFTSTDPNLLNFFAGVGAISLDGVALPVAVLGISGITVTLGTALPVTNFTGTTMFVYWLAIVQALTINNGEAICVNGISVMPVEADPNPNVLAILQNICLKLSAEIAFGCGQISKAHAAARLLSGFQPGGVTNTCKSCG